MCDNTAKKAVSHVQEQDPFSHALGPQPAGRPRAPQLRAPPPTRGSTRRAAAAAWAACSHSRRATRSASAPVVTTAQATARALAARTSRLAWTHQGTVRRGWRAQRRWCMRPTCCLHRARTRWRRRCAARCWWSTRGCGWRQVWGCGW
eukprot:145369-Chlamydomonas_euryale.AAC.1